MKKILIITILVFVAISCSSQVSNPENSSENIVLLQTNNFSKDGDIKQFANTLYRDDYGRSIRFFENGNAFLKIYPSDPGEELKHENLRNIGERKYSLYANYDDVYNITFSEDYSSLVINFYNSKPHTFYRKK